MDAPTVTRCQFIIWGIRHKHDPNIGIKIPYYSSSYNKPFSTTCMLLRGPTQSYQESSFIIIL